MPRKNIKRPASPKVTVVMPAYNASAFIEEAVESALLQNYRDFELLIADDRSTDDTWRIIRQYKDAARIRIFRNKKHMGSAATRNRLIRLARGEYITPLDADDILLQGNLRRLSNFLDRHPGFGVVYGNLLMLNIDRRKRLCRAPRVIGKDPDKNWDVINNVINHGGSMIRKSLILKVGGYDESVSSVDDRSLWLKIAEVTRFKYLKGGIYYMWRRHPGSITRTDKNAKRDAKRIIMEAIKRRYNYNMRF